MWGGAVPALLLGLSGSSGLPLFCRPPRPQVPFAVIGCLNGLHVFGAGAGVGLRGAETPGGSLAWAGDGHRVTLIALSPSPGPCGPALERLLSSARSAMVLVLGLDELEPGRNVERLKRELRSCFGLLDWLLSPGGGMGTPLRPLPPGTPRDRLQETLERFSGGAQTGLGALFGVGGGNSWGGGGQLLLATPPWWDLPPPDTALLGGLLGGQFGGQKRAPPARDLPLYLPRSSPTVPHRLLLLELVPGVGVALLCGPRPPLQLVQTQLVPQFWGPLVEQLRGCARPPPPPLPPPVLAYLLIHRRLGRSQSGVLGGRSGALPPQRRGAALQHLYALLAPQLCPQEDGEGPGPPPPCPTLLYWALGTHTGVALVRPELLLLLLLPPRAPRARLRPLALRALRALPPP